MKLEKYWYCRKVLLSNEKKKARVTLPRHAGVFRVWSVSEEEAVYTSVESDNLRLGNWSSPWGQIGEQIGVPSPDRHFVVEGLSRKRKWKVTVFIQYMTLRSADRYKRASKANANS